MSADAASGGTGIPDRPVDLSGPRPRRWMLHPPAGAAAMLLQNDDERTIDAITLIRGSAPASQTTVAKKFLGTDSIHGRDAADLATHRIEEGEPDTQNAIGLNLEFCDPTIAPLSRAPPGASFEGRAAPIPGASSHTFPRPALCSSYEQSV